MKSTSKILKVAMIALIIAGITTLVAFGDDKDALPPATLILTDYNGGKIEYVVIMNKTDASGRIAVCEEPDKMQYSADGKTVTIPLVNISDGKPFTQTGNFIIVVKNEASGDKQFIDGAIFRVKMTNGSVRRKWGGWMKV
jgi:hypothetical protein